MGERVDVEVILGDGIFPLTALAVRDDRAFAVIRTADASLALMSTSRVVVHRTASVLLKPADRALRPRAHQTEKSARPGRR